MINKRIFLLLMISIISINIIFSDAVTKNTLQFSGGYTKIVRSNGNNSVQLTENAIAKTEELSLKADEITISGENYNKIICIKNVYFEEKNKGISLQTPRLEFDRDANKILANGWIEIQDVKNEASISGAWLSYNIDSGILKVEMYARIQKSTSKGLMSCRADRISFDINNKILQLEGEANVEWGQDNYKASLIIIDLDKEEISMSGSIDGTVNG